MTEEVRDELDAIKRLLVLLLMKMGTETNEIATALAKDKATVSRLVPKRKIKPFSRS